MVRLRCPRCATIIDAAPGTQPLCPQCGFQGTIGQAPAAAAPSPPSSTWSGSQQQPAPGATPWSPSSVGAPAHGQPYGQPYGQHQAPYATGPAAPGYGVQPYGGFWIRVVSYLIDALILAVPNVLLTLLLAPGSFAADPTDPSELPSAGENVVTLISIVISWLYFAFMESSSKQATLGKMAVSLVVTDIHGDRISFGRATGRYFSKILSALILLIGFFMVGWTKRKQGLHDIIAGTLVYKQDHVPRRAQGDWAVPADEPTQPPPPYNP